MEEITPEDHALAAGAACTRCKIQIISSPSVTGTVFVQYYVPALGVNERGFLCGACGLAFREFLLPELTGDPVFRSAKAELLGGHW